MALRASLKRFLDLDGRFSDHEFSHEHFLVAEGNKVHTGLIIIEAAYGLIFSIITLIQGYYYQCVLNLLLFCFALLAWYIQQKGYTLSAKIFNWLQLIIMLGLMFYFPASPKGVHVNDSVLAFYIPVSIGTLIAFQGKEKKIGYILSLLILVVLVLLIVTDTHYPTNYPPIRERKFNEDLLYNFIGAATATFAEVVYILALNNRLNKSLIKANHELDNFVYIISHDLRSPLLSSKGLLDLAKLKSGNPDDLFRYLDMAGKSISNLDDIIQEILAYSRNNRTELKTETVNIKEIIQEIFNSLRFSTEDSFKFSLEAEGPTEIRSDKTRLKTVLRNIISNSVKYRKKNIPDAYVLVKFDNTGKNAVLQVSDNGEGIHPESIDHVFDMFYRGTVSGQGTGLGLYICKEMLEKMHASISIASIPDTGTTVTIQLQDTSIPS